MLFTHERDERRSMNPANPPIPTAEREHSAGVSLHAAHVQREGKIINVSATAKAPPYIPHFAALIRDSVTLPFFPASSIPDLPFPTFPLHHVQLCTLCYFFLLIFLLFHFTHLLFRSPVSFCMLNYFLFSFLPFTFHSADFPSQLFPFISLPFSLFP